MGGAFIMKTLLIGLFLIGHGLIHASYLTPKPDDPKYPFDFTKSWFANILGSFAKPVGITLATLAIFAFVLAGLGVLGFPGLAEIWRLLLGVGAISSLLLLILFWHSWLVLGLIIDTVLLYGVFVQKWRFGA